MAPLSPLKKHKLLDKCVANTTVLSSFASTQSSMKKTISSGSAYLSPIKLGRLPRNASTDTRSKQRDSSVNSSSRNSKLPTAYRVEVLAQKMVQQKSQKAKAPAPLFKTVMKKAVSTEVNKTVGATCEETAPLCPNSTRSKAVMMDQRFEIKRKIDQGTYAKVYLAQDWQQGGKQVVIKILRPRAYVKPSDKAQVKKEINNHVSLDHPNILKMLGHSYHGTMHVKGVADAENSYVYLVTEFLGRNYLNMFDLIENSSGNGFGEDAGRLFLGQMLNALEYLHTVKSVVHRDLKLENILIDSKLNFKLIDFGLSDSGDLKHIQGAVGSPSYVAPEVLEELVYDGSKVDIFSMGVLVFIMVLGKFPHGTKILKDKYYSLIRAKRYDAYFQAVDGLHCSHAFKTLIVKLLAYAPNERPTIAEIRQDPFLKEPSYNQERTRTKLMTMVHDISNKQQQTKN